MEVKKINSLVSTFLPLNIEGIDSLIELALDLSWSWYHNADEVWREVDPILWDLTHNPWVVLRTASWDKLKALLKDPIFTKKIDDLLQLKKNQLETPAWFQQKYPQLTQTCIAYFCMEYMLSEALPIYSGGLGNVAGDQLKAAGDLGIPVVAVGLLYQQGYFRQEFNKEGAQQALFPYNDPGQLPITPVRNSIGEWLRIEITLPGYSVWVRTWQVQVGTKKLYLLDSNDAANLPVYRGITSELYGGGSELRLKQELILGIGGWRLLGMLGLNPQVCHLNEGHAAFAILERARQFMVATGQSFDVALEVTRAGNLFTTHTAVSAGFDRFDGALITQYLEKYATNQLNISMDKLLGLGRQNPNNSNEQFNMAYLAIRGSGAVNGVSRLHGKVSQHLFEPLFPGWSEDQIPVGYITNGVHMPSWDSIAADRLWTKECGKRPWFDEGYTLKEDIEKIPDIKLWNMRTDSRKNLVEFTRGRYARQVAGAGASLQEIEEAKHIFDPNILTLGFARRFATYKRPNMLLQDLDRLIKILTNTNQPVQLILAGKAHPADKPGQELIKEWNQFIKRPEVRSKVVFLSDYDVNLTEQLVGGVDVWINTPRRPWEASGTSGMKVLVNGGINLSELDGWWAEAYTPEVGWAIGDGLEHGDDLAWDAIEGNALYEILEKEVIPTFYQRDSEGVPTEWVKKMRASMSQLTPHYSANRVVREYTETYYLAASKKYLERAENNGALGQRIVEWKNNLNEKWSSIRFSDVKNETKGDLYEFTVQVYLDGINASSISVQIYAEGENGSVSIKQEMKYVRQLAGDVNTHVYSGSVSASRPISHYTPRVIPFFPEVSVPLEISQVLWQH
ncbi:MAG: alpha-glucan family phosphorylase [Parachlamydiaceae bacterium]|nr:alpha-glucan family phosphorylase [Parachlamydiaceae bacterium]